MNPFNTAGQKKWLQIQILHVKAGATIVITFFIVELIVNLKGLEGINKVSTV